MNFVPGESIAAAEQPEPLFGRELLGDLISFDPMISARVQARELERFAPTQDPTGPLAELEQETLASMSQAELYAHAQLIHDYQWALSLAVYEYRGSAATEELRATAVGGLFSAVNSDREAGVGFLLHLSEKLAAEMQAAYGASPKPQVPSPAEFDAFVAEHYLDDYPRLPHEREDDHVSAGDIVLIMEDGSLVPGMVHAITENPSEPEFTLNQLPESELPRLQARVDRAFAQLTAEGSRITLGDPAADAAEIAEFEDRANLLPGQTTQPVELLFALGRAPLSIYAEYPQLVENPYFSRPQVTIVTDKCPDGVQLPVLDNRFLSARDWEAVSANPLFRQVFIESGHFVSQDSQDMLEAAIGDRKASGEPFQAPHNFRPAYPIPYRSKATHQP